MDLYQLLKKEQTDKKLESLRLSYNQMAKLSGLTVRQVRLEISRLIKSGHITFSRTGTNGTYVHEYRINENPQGDAYSIVKLLYCELTSERCNKDIDVIYEFNGYHRHFSKITDICKKEKLDTTLYMFAMFHTFPMNWCLQKFKKPFPPPFILANKVHARDRYETFLRFVHQHSEPEKIEHMTDKERLEEELRVWRMMGQPKSLGSLRLLVENGTISDNTFKYINTVKKVNVE